MEVVHGDSPAWLSSPSTPGKAFTFSVDRQPFLDVEEAKTGKQVEFDRAQRAGIDVAAVRFDPPHPAEAIDGNLSRSREPGLATISENSDLTCSH